MNFSESSISSQISSVGPHERIITEFFGERARYVSNAPVFASALYLMAFTNRCGSNLLADYMRQTGSIGGFHESLNHDTVLRAANKRGIESVPDYVEMLHKKFSSSGNLGVKASWDQILMLSRFKIFEMFNSVRVIHIRRTDVISQAVSHWIAHQTKQWTSNQTGLEIEPTYDFDRISTIISSINNANGMITLIAEALSRRHVSITYEALERSPQDSVVMVLRKLGLPHADIALDQPRISKQADERNTAFINRYKAELRARIAKAG